MKPLAVITGVGPGTGAALVRRFLLQLDVLLLASESSLRAPPRAVAG